jgi:hypothetical protein
MIEIKEKIDHAAEINKHLMALLEIAKRESNLQLSQQIADISDSMKPMIQDFNSELNKILN